MRRRYYLAYGSNLNIVQMQKRCPHSKPIGSVVLEGYELLFHGVASIGEKEGSYVPCGLWLISKRDEISLDRYEGFPRMYRKEMVPIVFGKRRMKVMTYIMNGGKPALPSGGYLKTILDGYRDFGLDQAALEEALHRTPYTFRWH